MKNDIVRFVFILGVLVCAGAAEVMLPDIGGVGFPLLLTVALLAAEVWSSRFWVLTALAAGALEDALCSLPFAASISFFLTAAFAARLSSAPGAVTVLAYPLFQLWAGILSPGGNSFACRTKQYGKAAFYSRRRTRRGRRRGCCGGRHDRE